MKFTFGDIVVVEDRYIGVVVKCWEKSVLGTIPANCDVYVRSFNAIKNYPVTEIQRYMVRHKELNDEEYYYQQKAMKGE
jgi:hypothetical protein